MRRGTLTATGASLIVFLAGAAPLAAAPAPAGHAGATAREDPRREEAKAEFNQGNTDYNLGKYNEAIAHFEKAYSLSRVPEILFNLFPGMGGHSPQTLGGTPVALFLYVEDVDAVFARAVAAGATPKMPPADMFWGDRYAKLTDPFGHDWGLATHVEDVSPEETNRRAEAFFARMAQQQRQGQEAPSHA